MVHVHPIVINNTIGITCDVNPSTWYGIMSCTCLVWYHVLRTCGMVSRPARGMVSCPARGMVSCPACGMVSRPARGMVSRPARGMVSCPARGMVSCPACGMVSRPVYGMVSRPVRGMVSRPARGMVSRPARGMVSRPAHGMVSSPARGMVSRPVYGMAACGMGVTCTQVAEYSFAYGVQYAWNLVIFAMVMTFSLTAPLIVPAGMYSTVPRWASEHFTDGRAVICTYIFVCHYRCKGFALNFLKCDGETVNKNNNFVRNVSNQNPRIQDENRGQVHSQQLLVIVRLLIILCL